MTDSSFVRRRFTITEALNEVLDQLAKHHYQGNVSLCLRAAIEEHRTTLQGTDSVQPEIEQLAMQIQRMAENQGDLREVIETIPDKINTTSRNEGKQMAGPPGVAGDSRVVYEALRASDSGLRFDDLQEKLDLPASRVQPALGALLNSAHVVRSAENRHRFVLPGNAAASNPGDRQ